MKPAPFVYHAPRDLEGALGLLAEHGEEAKPLAGGQSLVPAMNFRLAQPRVLIDLNRVAELAYGREREAGVEIGAMARQRAVQDSDLVRRRLPLVAEAMPHIAHPQIRNRGTFGGSVAHADPAAELPAVVLALGGELVVRSTRGERVVGAGDFFHGLFATALRPDELLVAVRLPAQAAGVGSAFVEAARRHGDFALVGVAALVRRDPAGRCHDARIALLSVGDRPELAAAAQAQVAGEAPSPELLRSAGEAAARGVDPTSDIHASARYRRHLVAVLVRRALALACARAVVGSPVS